jgi:4-hydroxy-3-polyprenylbenzoate decarboxylase
LAYDDLREWITALERAGELRVIQTEVDPILEIAEIAASARGAMARANPAVLRCCLRTFEDTLGRKS